MDDGDTFAYSDPTCEQSYMQYSYSENILSAFHLNADCLYPGAWYKMITTVTFYGIMQEPDHVELLSCCAGLEWTYNATEQSLEVTGLDFEVDSERYVRHGEIQMIKVVYADDAAEPEVF